MCACRTPHLYRTTTSDRFRADRLDFDREDEAWIEEDEEDMDNHHNNNNNNSNEDGNKPELISQNVTNNSFSDEHENNLDTFIELKKTTGMRLHYVWKSGIIAWNRKTFVLFSERD
jgi:hypothetical protein